MNIDDKRSHHTSAQRNVGRRPRVDDLQTDVAVIEVANSKWSFGFYVDGKRSLETERKRRRERRRANVSHRQTALIRTTHTQSTNHRTKRTGYEKNRWNELLQTERRANIRYRSEIEGDGLVADKIDADDVDRKRLAQSHLNKTSIITNKRKEGINDPVVDESTRRRFDSIRWRTLLPAGGAVIVSFGGSAASYN
jgi:hypothetical protein